MNKESKTKTLIETKSQLVVARGKGSGGMDEKGGEE